MVIPGLYCVVMRIVRIVCLHVRTVAMAFISAPFTEVCFDLVFLSLSMQYIVLVIVVFVLQTIGGILAFTYREEVSYTIDNIDYVTWIGNSTGSSILNVRA